MTVLEIIRTCLGFVVIAVGVDAGINENVPVMTLCVVALAMDNLSGRLRKIESRLDGIERRKDEK